MIVRDDGDSWQVVLQTDHADLSGRLARAWVDGRQTPGRTGSLLTAARRHDDGWAVWERAPTLTADGRPTNFLEVPLRTHLALFRAAARAVAEEDPYAGALVSTHGSGIYRGRYGTAGELRLGLEGTDREAVEAFIAEQEAEQSTLLEEAGVGDGERWTHYRLLQAFDLLSLFFCFAQPGAGTQLRVDRVPLDGGTERSLAVESVGEGHATIEPFPFEGRSAELTLRRRVVARREWVDPEEFREELFATPLEHLRVVLEAA